MKVVCTLPVSFSHLEFPLPCILNVIVQGICYEVELVVPLKGCLPRGTLGDFCRNVLAFPKLWLQRQITRPDGWHFRREMDVEPKPASQFYEVI